MEARSCEGRGRDRDGSRRSEREERWKPGGGGMVRGGRKGDGKGEEMLDSEKGWKGEEREGMFGVDVYGIWVLNLLFLLPYLAFLLTLRLILVVIHFCSFYFVLILSFYFSLPSYR